MSDHENASGQFGLTSDEIVEAQRLFRALQVFRDAYPDMTVAQASALLLAASSREPLSMSGIRAALNVAASTATRAVLTLSKVTREGVRRRGGEDFGLVAQSVDPKDRRWRFTHCTPFGLETVRTALSRSVGDAVAGERTTAQ